MARRNHRNESREEFRNERFLREDSGCRRFRERPLFIQDKRRFARYSPEGYRQCNSYFALYRPADSRREFRQEKFNCQSFEDFRRF